MTRPGVVTEPEVDPVEALRSLGYPEISPPDPVVGGWETLMWRFSTPDGREHSLRIYCLSPEEEIAWRERTAMRTCEAADLPAPRVEATGVIAGQPAVVLSWCPGTPILSILESRPWTLWRVGRLFGRMQAKLHQIAPPEEFTGSAPDDWISFAGDKYPDLIEHAKSLQLSTDRLIHMDYHPLNVVSDGKSITGVLDWARSAAGDPRADLARTEVTYLWAPLPPGPMRLVFDMLRRAILMAWRSGYKEEAGSIPDYRPLRAWAGATLLAETEPAIGRKGVWATEEDAKRLRELIDRWARESGIR